MKQITIVQQRLSPTSKENIEIAILAAARISFKRAMGWAPKFGAEVKDRIAKDVAIGFKTVTLKV